MVTQQTVLGQILTYMDGHFDVITLKPITVYFSYHSSYISVLRTKRQGGNFEKLC